MNEVIIAPSMLAADFGNLQKEVEMVNNSKADWFHIDIMDGVFVPNISFGLPVTEAISKHAIKPLDVHLMIVNPEKYIKAFFDVGASIITVHQETTPHLDRILHQIKELGIKAGVVLNPSTPISSIENVIQECDLVLLMSVNPGFGGQKFISNTLKKVNQLKSLILQNNSKALIEIDGGVNIEIAKKLVAEGADALVAGSFVFSAKEPLKIIEELKNIEKPLN